ncbi:nuclear transport factor 2 family protein [Actinomadura welshii]
METATPTRTAEQLVTELFDIIDGRRWDELGSVFADDCVYRRPGYEPIVGLARLQHFYRHERIVASGEHSIEHTVSDLGTVVCWGTFTGESEAGRPLDEGFADVYRVRDGKIAQRRTYFYRPGI